MKHTKGNWINGYGVGLTGPTTPSARNPTVDKDRGYIPISINKQTIAIVIQPENDSIEEMESNAKLIVQAPKMLEAMILFCDRVDRGEVRSKKTYASFKEIIKATE